MAEPGTPVQRTEGVAAVPSPPTVAPGDDGLAERVTVVLLTYNCAHRLGRVLDELTALGVPVVAVDNASADGTVDVLRARPGLEVVPLPENIGAAARNAGAERAATPYLAFCDDDGWYDRDGLVVAADLLDRHPRLALVNARILIRDEARVDPISTIMSRSPLADTAGIPGAVLLSFMAGASVVRRSAYLEAGGYEPVFFMGGEEETLSFKWARTGWHMRYVPEVVMRHHPSVANAPRMRAFGMRNTLWNAWLHRRFRSAAAWTLFILADSPKNRDWWRGVAMAVRGLPWVLRRRSPMDRALDAQLSVLDRDRFAQRRPLFNRIDPLHRRSGGSPAAAPPAPPAAAPAAAADDPAENPAA
ncbi:glycosyltransferase family 2 protein [Nakamurella endophytica]|uniref:Transferase n=1 Tax=Nakamurella endophytica TaxID=1748367 RepID=A0A917SNX7_9ACTN|nr:glycosyltransferase [Nakamurella endophytica]GGL88106.1 transferase [Nakamurella endophytica]